MTAEGLQTVVDRIEKIAGVISYGAAESEQLGRLSPPVADALHDAGVFRILVPEEYGGSGLNVPESFEVFERIAALDASTGWAAAILADGAIFARFLGPEVFATLFADERCLIAGSLNPMTARAEIVDGGFVYSGKATYLSGSEHAQWVMVAALVTRDGEPVIDDGISIRAGVFPIERARRLDTWRVTGMRATGSNDYEFDGVEVGEQWTFEPFRARVGAGDDPFEWIPLWSQLGGGLAAVAVGAAHNMIERFVELAAVKVPVGNFTPLAERVPAQIAVGEAQGLYQAARAVLFDTGSDIWARGVAHTPFTNDMLARHRLGTVTAVRLAARAIDLLHDAAGMSAVATDSVLDRCWRDVHTMTQHVILAPPRFEIAGRVLLGLDPQSPVI